MKNSKEIAYQILKERILDSTYQPNTIIEVNKVADELNTSRTPVREALIALSQEGYVQFFPRRGILVTPFTYKDALDIWQIRELIEPWCVKQYGASFTEEELAEIRKQVLYESDQEMNTNAQPTITFRHQPHTAILEKCDNKNVIRLLNYVEEQSRRIPDPSRVLKPKQFITEDQKQQALNNHLKLVELLEQKRIEEAVKNSEEHVIKGKEDYMKFWYQ